MTSSGPRIRILYSKKIALGPGKADLLTAIHETGSISAAARHMRMSYRRAWLLVNTMNQSFLSPLVYTATGGSGGGGAGLTPLGQRILELYRSMEQKAQKAIAGDVKTITSLLAPQDQK